MISFQSCKISCFDDDQAPVREIWKIEQLQTVHASTENFILREPIDEESGGLGKMIHSRKINI